MANKILYEDKETFQVSPLDEINKATADNFNEIKDVVNFNADEIIAAGSSAGDANEVQTSDGAGGFVASKLFFDEVTGNMILGDSGLAGDRTITVISSTASASLIIVPKGNSGFIKVIGSADVHRVDIGQDVANARAQLNLIGNHDTLPVFIGLDQNGNADVYVKLGTGGTGDPFYSLNVSGRFYTIGIDNSVNDELVIGTSSVLNSPSQTTKRIRMDATGMAFFDVTPIAQPANTKTNREVLEDLGLVATGGSGLSILVKTANYTLVADDDGKIVEGDTNSFTITLPDGMPVGYSIQIVNKHATEVVTIAATTTLNAKGTKLASQWGGCTAYHSGSNVWIAIGDLTT